MRLYITVMGGLKILYISNVDVMNITGPLSALKSLIPLQQFRGIIKSI